MRRYRENPETEGLKEGEFLRRLHKRSPTVSDLTLVTV